MPTIAGNGRGLPDPFCLGCGCPNVAGWATVRWTCCGESLGGAFTVVRVGGGWVLGDPWTEADSERLMMPLAMIRQAGRWVARPAVVAGWFTTNTLTSDPSRGFGAGGTGPGFIVPTVGGYGKHDHLAGDVTMRCGVCSQPRRLGAKHRDRAREVAEGLVRIGRAGAGAVIHQSARPDDWRGGDTGRRSG